MAGWWSTDSGGGGGGSSALSDLSQGFGLTSQLGSIAQELQTGSTKANVQAATTAAKLGSQTGAFGTASSTVGSFAADVTNLTNIIQGIQRGGVTGYGGAAANAGMLAGRLAPMLAREGLVSAGASADLQLAGNAAGMLAVPLSLYQFAKSWQSGATGADALAGMQTGATIGTAVLPGVGTLIGAGIGAAAGALTSVFGGGKADMETTEWNQLTGKFNALTPTQQSQVIFSPQQAFINLAGTMDAKNNSPGHSQPIEQVFGRMGEANLVNQMTRQINRQLEAGAITKNSSVNDIYNKVVAPWLASKGASINMGERTTTGHAEGPALVQSLKSLIGAYASGALTSQTAVGAQGQTIPGLQPFGTTDQQIQAQIQAQKQHTQSLHALIGSFPLGKV